MRHGMSARMSTMVKPNAKRTHPPATKLRMYLHLVPIFGMAFSLWSLYGSKSSSRPGIRAANTSSGNTSSGNVPSGNAPAGNDISIENTHIHTASPLSIVLGVGCISAITLLNAMASTQPSHIATLRFLIGSSFIGSGYFLVSLALMFRVAKDQSIRLPGLTPLSRRLP